jgi:hypothetical protein
MKAPRLYDFIRVPRWSLKYSDLPIIVEQNYLEMRVYNHRIVENAEHVETITHEAQSSECGRFHHNQNNGLEAARGND